MNDARDDAGGADARQAEAFLDALFGAAPADLHLLLWELRRWDGESREASKPDGSPGKAKRRSFSRWFPVGRRRDFAAAAALACRADADVYVQVSLSPQPFGPHRRCPAEAAAGIVGLWADIDVRGPAHKTDDLPATEEEARSLAEEVGLSPSMILHTGHGLQVWWLFNDPWVFRSDAERQEAAGLARRWVGLIQAKGKLRGWRIDSTGDLARVLRVPGTMNNKILDDGTPLPPVPVHAMTDGCTTRYTVEDFLAVLSVPADRDRQQATPAVVCGGAAATDRARAYVAKMPEAVSGNRGHEAGWAVGQALIRGFGLSTDEARPLFREYSERCSPPWSDAEIEHKLTQAHEKSRRPSGYLLNRDRRVKTPESNGAASCRQLYKTNGHAPADPDARVAWEERAAVMEFDGALPRPEAERGADDESLAVRLDSVQFAHVEWVWAGRIPLGAVTILDGDPGLGKSFITLDLASRESRGEPMPNEADGVRHAPGGVLLLNAEDDLARTIVPRLNAMGADMTRIFSFESVPTGEGPRPVVLPFDLPAIERLIVRHAVRLVVLDPIMAFLDPMTDSHKDADIRRLMYSIRLLAERRQVAVVVVRHLNKLVNVTEPLYRGGGSIGIIGAARSGLMVAKHPDDEDQRVLVPVKHNLCAAPLPLAYRIATDDGVARVEWLGVAEIEADGVLGGGKGRQRRDTEAQDRARVKDAGAKLLSALDKIDPDRKGVARTPLRDLARVSHRDMVCALQQLIDQEALVAVDVEARSGKGRVTVVEGVKRP